MSDDGQVDQEQSEPSDAAEVLAATAADAARRYRAKQRSMFIERYLDETWIEVEPGIFERRGVPAGLETPGTEVPTTD